MVYGNDQPPSNSFRNAFVITGGKGSDGQYYNDVWSFDFIRECWVEIKATGKIFYNYIIFNNNNNYNTIRNLN